MKTVLITGASSGIGQACAERLADQFHLVLSARNKERLESLASFGTDTKIFVTDVRQYEQVEARERARRAVFASPESPSVRFGSKPPRARRVRSHRFWK